jgi:hypothetical protein
MNGYDTNIGHFPYTFQRHATLKRKLMDKPFKIDLYFFVFPSAALF